MKLSEKYLKDMKRMKIANIVVWAIGIITFTINWLLYFFHMDNGIEGNKLVSIIVELITGIIFLCLMLYDHKAIKKRMKVSKSLFQILKKEKCLCNDLKLNNISLYKLSPYHGDSLKYFVFKMPEYHKQKFRKGEL